jgi:hypothetical protein
LARLRCCHLPAAPSIEIGGEIAWDRKRDGDFPDAKTLKRLVRDRIDPQRDLGHADRPSDDIERIASAACCHSPESGTHEA